MDYDLDALDYEPEENTPTTSSQAMEFSGESSSSARLHSLESPRTTPHLKQNPIEFYNQKSWSGDTSNTLPFRYLKWLIEDFENEGKFFTTLQLAKERFNRRL